MYQDLKDNLIALLKSRLFPLLLVIIAMGVVLIVRVFTLQIVKGESYEENYQLKIVRERSIPSTRGNIYDRNGNLLAYNELAYSITLEDVYESNSNKNKLLNESIYNLIVLVEKNGDNVISGYEIGVDDNNNFVFNVEGTKLLRFLADIYGHKSIDDLKYEERNAKPYEVVEYLCSKKKYGIGKYEVIDGKTEFTPMGDYANDKIIKIITIRAALGANTYQKYVTTTVATNVSEKTRAVVLENADIIPGVSISQEAIRKYNDSVYFSQIIGYTGKISVDEYEEYVLENPDYSLNDYVGKTGIEYSQENYLKGEKGKETIYVDVLGRVLDTTDYIKPSAGNDVYLTIDKDLQMAVYHIIEQNIAGILVSKIRNIKEYVPDENASAADIVIPIDDVYNALFENNVIDFDRFSKEYASPVEKDVYSSFVSKQTNVLDEIKTQLVSGGPAYSSLSKEYQNYESFIIQMLSSDAYGVIKTSEIDTNDLMYIAWTKDENISIKEYLSYCISKNWININTLDLEGDYSDSDEIYSKLVELIIDSLANNKDFSKKIYKYMIAGNNISGKQICLILWNQDLINVDQEEIIQLKENRISSYQFMLNCIEHLEITPAQLALEPCSGSCVITSTSGEVLALVSYPSFDNNRLANSADSAYLAKINSDGSMPLWNYATQYRSAPGSTFKMVSSVAGLEEGVINLGTNIECNGIFDKLNGTTHRCWIYPGRHGNLDVTGGIANSCNNFFYEVGYRLSTDIDGYNDDLGTEKIAKYADLFGLSEKSGIEISESEPKVSDALPVPSAIGQGTHAYTTVGLARYVTAVANRGTVYNLTLIDNVKDPYGEIIYDSEPTIRNTINLENSEWNAIHSGMRQVVMKKAYFDIGVSVAGKTGTAQESTKKANHALFVGFAPYNNPEIVIATRIMNGYSSDYAAQMSKDVFVYYYGLKEKEEIITGTADQPLSVVGAGD